MAMSKLIGNSSLVMTGIPATTHININEINDKSLFPISNARVIRYILKRINRQKNTLPKLTNTDV